MDNAKAYHNALTVKNLFELKTEKEKAAYN